MIKVVVEHQAYKFSFLIETNEREQIAEIIILAPSIMGYNSSPKDITEKWRER